MPKITCATERKAFVDAAQKYADASANFFIAKSNLEAAIWESGASDIEMVKEATETVHDFAEGHLADKLAVRVIGVMKSVASDKAAEARIKGAKAAFDIALKKLQSAEAALERAKKALDDCDAKHKPPRQVWSGFWTTVVTARGRAEQHRGAMGLYGHTAGQFSGTTRWTIVGPKSSKDRPNLYLARWEVSADGTSGAWGKPDDTRHLVGTTTTTTTSGHASGLAEVEIDYADSVGLDVTITPPDGGKDCLLITEREIGGPTPSYSLTKRNLPIGSGGIEKARGQKLKGSTIKGTRTKTSSKAEFLPVAGFSGTYTTTTQWNLEVTEVPDP